MLKEAIGTGSTVENAQQAAVEALAAPENADVHFEVLELPVKKTFGLFGGSPAKVKAFYELEEEKASPVPQKKKKTEFKEKEKLKKSETAKTINYEDAVAGVKKAHDYLLKIVKGMGLSDPKIEISNYNGENYLNIISDEDYSLIIGRRGETLDSIQYLVRLIANRNKNENEYVRISINIGNYRQKRERTLKDIARKSANRAVRYNRNVALDPMNPFERRIIHTVVAEINGVSSHSVGSNDERRVIITPANGSRYGSRGGYKKGGYNKNRNSGKNVRSNNNRRDYRPKNETTSAPKREPKSDAEGTSLYGKIELNK